MEGITQAVLRQLEERGVRGRIVSIDRLPDLQEGITSWHRQGILDEELYRTYLSSFGFSPPEDLPGARSLLVVASPQPPTRLTFTWQGEAIPAIVPPTYIYHKPFEKVSNTLAEVLGSAGYRAMRANVPVKLLAVRSGLGRYGRNNICYVPGLGSLHALRAFFSDLPCPEDAWQEPVLLAACEHCTACRRHCPTGALTADRFLLHAERCLTWHNERTATLPAWLEPGWHNAIIGCMHCQRVCPENRPFLERVEPGPEFSAEETSLLLSGSPAEALPAETVAKLTAVDLMEALDVLPRNLGFLIDNQRAAHG